MPGNNTFDHGFYQFSPMLFAGYYKANQYKILAIVVMEIIKDMYHSINASCIVKWQMYRNWQYDPVLMGNSFWQLGANLYFTMTCIQKQKNSIRNIAPTQYLFSNNHKMILSPWE
jgi:hypothetical protein